MQGGAVPDKVTDPFPKRTRAEETSSLPHPRPGQARVRAPTRSSAPPCRSERLQDEQLRDTGSDPPRSRRHRIDFAERSTGPRSRAAAIDFRFADPPQSGDRIVIERPASPSTSAAPWRSGRVGFPVSPEKCRLRTLSRGASPVGSPPRPGRPRFEGLTRPEKPSGPCGAGPGQRAPPCRAGRTDGRPRSGSGSAVARPQRPGRRRHCGR